MEQIVFLLALIAGFLFGAAIVWLIQRSDIRQSYDRARTEFAADIRGLNERVKGHEVRVAELRASLDERERHLAEIQEENINLKTMHSELQSRAEADPEARQSLGASLAALEQSQAELAQRFQAMTEDAIRSSQESFLVAAKTQLESVRPAEIAAGAPLPVELPSEWCEKLESLQESIKRIEAGQDNGAAHEPVQVELPAEWNETLRSFQESVTRLEAGIRESGSHNPVPELQGVIQPLEKCIQRVETRIRDIEESRTSGKREIDRLNEDLRAAQALGKSVQDALLVFGERFAAVGRSLEVALENHTDAAVYLENKVLAAARDLKPAQGTPQAPDQRAYALVPVHDIDTA